MNAPATKVESDEFESAFNEFAGDKEVPVAEVGTPAGETEPEEAPAADAEPAVSEGSAEAPESGEGEAEEAPEPAAKSEPAADEDDVDWEAAFRALKSKVEKGEVVAPPKAEEPPPPPEQDIYSAEEKKILKAYETDWPEVSKGEALRRRAEYRDLAKFFFDEVAKSLKPLYDYYGESSDDLQYRSITKVHKDYDAVYEPLQKWIAQQPRYLKATYEQVAKEGTADDVVDLITRFKKETDWKTPAPEQQGGEKPPVKSSKGLPTTAKQAAKSLGAVGTKRTTVADSRDPNDFDGAFEEFVKADAKR